MTEREHFPQPVLRGPKGESYCNRFSVHEAWVVWPCDEAS